MPQPKQPDRSERSEQSDPTVTSASMAAGDPYPEGTHPVRPPSEVTHSATRIEYRGADDKPDPSSIVQIAEIPEGWPGA